MVQYAVYRDFPEYTVTDEGVVEERVSMPSDPEDLSQDKNSEGHVPGCDSSPSSRIRI